MRHAGRQTTTAQTRPGRACAVPADALGKVELGKVEPLGKVALGKVDLAQGTRAERREPQNRRHLDLPWVGPIPQVGRSSAPGRAAWRGRLPRQNTHRHALAAAGRGDP